MRSEIRAERSGLGSLPGYPPHSMRLPSLPVCFPRRADGTWLEASSDLVAFISHQEGRTTFKLGNIPPASYTALRFTVGLDSETNHLDPNQFPPDHALSPQLNNLHWTWQSGYIFFALEGHSSNDLGFSYHLGNDPNTATVTLPTQIDTATSQTINLQLDLSQVLGGEGIDYLTTTSTHSREGDPTGPLLKSRLSQAFSVSQVREGTYHPSQTTTDLVASTHGTPYPDFIKSNLPKPALPKDNPLTREGVALGSQLFHDPIFSSRQNQSCASCHDQSHAFSDSARLSLGSNGEPGARNSMPLFNLAWHKEMFWDGRAKTLREQILHPVQDPLEMDLSLAELAKRLNQHPRYPLRFEKAFGTRDITPELFAKAIEQYLLTLVSQDSRFDQALRGEVEFTDLEKRGFELFVTEYDPDNNLKGADCFHCHGGPLLTNHTFANNGLDADFSDLGREIVSKNSSDRGKFKVPSLRNIALTGPYMHDGRFDSLEQVVEHYNSGVQRSATLDPNLAKHPNLGLDLTTGDKAALLAFLHSLTDETFTQN